MSITAQLDVTGHDIIDSDSTTDRLLLLAYGPAVKPNGQVKHRTVLCLPLGTTPVKFVVWDQCWRRLEDDHSYTAQGDYFWQDQLRKATKGFYNRMERKNPTYRLGCESEVAINGIETPVVAAGPLVKHGDLWQRPIWFIDRLTGYQVVTHATYPDPNRPAIVYDNYNARTFSSEENAFEAQAEFLRLGRENLPS